MASRADDIIEVKVPALNITVAPCKVREQINILQVDTGPGALLANATTFSGSPSLIGLRPLISLILATHE